MKRFASAFLVLCAFGIWHSPAYAQTVAQDKSNGTVMKQFEPTWESLSKYQVPEWFQNAKFGIWAHWGPQCQPEQGDWYGRLMYDEGSEQYNWHVANYGHPSKAGFKEVINSWKAEKWDPEKLVALYKRVGAQYFFAMANHHDNLDLWNSKFHEWNSVRVGPKKDIVNGWAKASKKFGLPFGLSVHSSHAWTWFETAQRSDKKGPLAGVPYDGKLTKADGKGTWWDGLDPQALYAQNHPLSKGSDTISSLWRQWDWGNGASLPSKEYYDQFYNRVVDLIDQYNPDLLYFDDTVLPFYPVSDVGLKIASHYYNHNLATHGNKLEAVLFGKILNEEQKKCMVWDVERGALDAIQNKPWQVCTCIGEWHYRRSVYEQSRYKSAAQVIYMLSDIVSKNGNMLLNIPIRGDGTIDEKEIQILEQIAAWMDLNKESIFDTRPWVIFGEGPSADRSNPVNGPGFNEGNLKYSAADIRYTQKGKVIYATTLGKPEDQIVLKALGKKNAKSEIKKVELLGTKEKISWKQSDENLSIQSPAKLPNDIAAVFKVTMK
jgi:alpha-L-fucosidase